MGVYLQAGEELGELRKERKKHEADEAGLGGGLGHLVPVHEGSHRETLQLLRVALGTDVETLKRVARSRPAGRQAGRGRWNKVTGWRREVMCGDMIVGKS